VAGLWLEAHQDDEHEVGHWCANDQADGNFGVVTHVVLQCEKEPGACHAPGFT